LGAAPGSAVNVVGGNRLLAQHRLDARERDIPAAAGEVDQVAAHRACHREHARQARIAQADPAKIRHQRAGEGLMVGIGKALDLARLDIVAATGQAKADRLSAYIGHQRHAIFH
jgi:hypothetical protein